MKRIADFLGNSVAVLFGFLWITSAFAGAVYGAINGDLLDIVFSIFIPLYGWISIFLSFF